MRPKCPSPFFRVFFLIAGALVGLLAVVLAGASPIVLAGSSPIAPAEDPPAEAIVLTVEGPAEGQVRAFTEEEIRALPKTAIATFDPWDKRQRTYAGCAISDLIKSLGADEAVRMVEIIAVNNYMAKIPMEEIVRHGHILSYEMDGKDYALLGDENKGPLAVAVEMERVDPANRVRAQNQLVWWVEKMRLK